MTPLSWPLVAEPAVVAKASISWKKDVHCVQYKAINKYVMVCVSLFCILTGSSVGILALSFMPYVLRICTIRLSRTKTRLWVSSRPARMASFIISKHTWRTISDGRDSRSNSDRQTCHPCGSDRSWPRKSRAWDLELWSQFWLKDNSIAFSVWIHLERQRWGRTVVARVLRHQHKGSRAWLSIFCHEIFACK